MEEIEKKLGEVIGRVFGDLKVEIEVTEAPEGQMVAGEQADWSSNVAMKICKQVGKAPRDVAGEISQEMNKIGIQAEVAGPGFLNFISPDEYYIEKIGKMVGSEDEFAEKISGDEYAGKTVICEFSDPNPFKVLHVGHLYTSIVGDAISRLYENAGAKVVRANFGGDVGLHVAKTLYAIRQQLSHSSSGRSGALAQVLNPSEEGSAVATPESLQSGENDSADNAKLTNLLAEAYVQGTRAYEEDEKAHDEITKLNGEIYRIAAEDVHEGELAELYWRGREASYKYFEDFYARIGVKFDKYYPESTVAGRGVKEIKSHPEVYEESDGATVFKGEKYGLHTRVFLNKAGLPTYEAKDVGLIFTKWDDYKFDKSIVITGNDITEYMKVVLKSISLYAPELVERTTHLTHGQVKLPGAVKMSSRLGNFVKAVDILDMVSEKVSDEKIALAAIKYAMLKYKIGGDFDFDVESSVSTTGNSGVYLLYSAVRARKILDKVEFGEIDDYKFDEHEKKLVKKVVLYPKVLEEAREEMAPHKICTYLYELAQEFSRFYENTQVAGSDSERERGAMVLAYYNVMTHGLKLLGIEVPEEM